MESSRYGSPAAQACGSEAAGAVGDGLRRMFDDVVSAPMPPSLVELCDALEDAFQRGKLTACGERKRTA